MTRSDIKGDFDGKVGRSKGRRGLTFEHGSNDVILLSEGWLGGVWGRYGNGGLCSRLSKTESFFLSVPDDTYRGD